MQTWLFATYILTISLIIITPGPNAILMISHSLHHGKNAIYPNALGSILASSVLIFLSLIGVGSVISEEYFYIFSLIGSVYLVYLGLSKITTKEVNFTTQENKTIGNPQNYFSQAFLTGLSNPKDILFFIILLPQFIDQDISFFISATTLLVGWIICDFLIMCSYGLFAIKIKSNMKNHHTTQVIRFSGGIIIILGITLFISITI